MQHSESITIYHSRADVWAVVGDPQSWEEWIDGITDIQVEGGGALAVGKGLSYKWRGKIQNTTVIELEAGHRIHIGSAEKNYDFNETIVLTDVGVLTKVTMTVDFNPTVWWASVLAVFMLPFKGLLLGRPFKKQLQALSRVLE